MWSDGFRDAFMMELIMLEGRSGIRAKSEKCQCEQGGEPIYHCTQCFGTTMMCKECIIRQHQSYPFHVIRVSLVPHPSCWFTVEKHFCRCGTDKPSSVKPSKTSAYKSSSDTHWARSVSIPSQSLANMDLQSSIRAASTTSI